MGHPSKYFADDKDVYDLLMSQKRGLGDDELRRFLRERGFVVSGLVERESLAQYVSRLPLNYRDLASLLDHVESRSPRTARVTSENVGASLEQFESAANVIGNERSVRRDESYKMVRRADGVLDVHVDYSVVDTGKNKLRQRQEMHAVISVETSDTGIRVRYPEEPRAKEIADGMIVKVLGDPKEHVRNGISLAGCSAEQRTRFFEQIMKDTSGFTLRTVTRAGFRKIEPSGHDGSEGNASEDDDLPGVADEEPGARILRVQLDGEGVFLSQEFQALKVSGFYVNSAVWIARQQAGEGVDAEFEAGFVTAETGTTFSYRLRGVVRRSETGEHTRTRVAASEVERNGFLGALESAAERACAAVREAASAQRANDRLEDSDEADTGERAS